MAIGQVSTMLSLALLAMSAPTALAQGPTQSTSADDSITGSASSGDVSDLGPSSTITDTDDATGSVSSGAAPELGPPDETTSDAIELGPECDFFGSDAHYEEMLSGEGATMERIAASKTGCPNHINWGINPNEATQNPSNASIPAYPMLFADGGLTDLAATEGQVGILLNGVALFSSWAVGVANTFETSAFYLESDSFDLCGGHSTPFGEYHFHSTPGCLQEQAMVVAGTTSSEHSPQIGWAYDGFPLYGQLGPDGVEMLMCGADAAHETYCLDQCAGYEGELPGVDDFKYRYYTTCGFDEDFYPFVTNCYRGCCPEGASCTSPVRDCEESPEEGYTAGYTPALATVLSEQYDAELISGDDAFFVGSNVSVDCSLFLGSATASNAADVDDDGGDEDDDEEVLEADGALSVSSSRLVLSLLSVVAVTATYLCA